MSAEVEHVSSRNRLREDIIEAGKYQKSWAQAGLIPFQDAFVITSSLEELENQALNIEVRYVGGRLLLDSSSEEQQLPIIAK
ncbi:unnamed protein product [Tuber aestivum]|uniref:Uncharacterized protein n=1 Tax=Tuber aestivum TaxID=59557 RepID=A0A292PJW7_9PEZI|nr:unnamed protein product [Tuber aestivum]